MEDEYELCFELITTSSLTPSAQNDLATFQKQLADLSEKDDIASQLNLVDADELRRRYDLALARGRAEAVKVDRAAPPVGGGP